MTTPPARLRPVRPEDADDLAALRVVCRRTGDAGEDATGRWADPDLLGDVWAVPYALHDPSLATLVEDAEGVGGYLVATADTLAFEAWARREWWPRVRADPRRQGLDPDGPDRALLAALGAPPGPRPWLPAHPAHLHVDLLPRLQGAGLGRRLVEHLVAALAARGVPGVHLGVAAANVRARGFYAATGFVPLEAPGAGDGIVLGRPVP
ncbi:GNAT family N-acetyltransferase [Cellulomonas endophytica]|uniref:GNAT family N-acetyltransferase n=1 Tax=Cellulomonas endophytica TaxID=2494735 RepID=UPI001013AB50|nr:GNAT family N-acetyltransferase [Cellulomonas endophytica]